MKEMEKFLSNKKGEEMKGFCIKCDETFEFEEDTDLDEIPCPNCGNWYSLIEEE